MTATTVAPRSCPVDDLTPEHRHQLEVVRGIPAEILAEAGLRSLPGAYALPTPSEDLRHPDPQKARRFGQYPDVISPGIHIPFPDADGTPITYQYRSDHPRKIKKTDARTGTVTWRTVKYESPPGCRLSLYIPPRTRPVLDDVTVPLAFTEGPLKALGLSGAGAASIGLSGVDGWKVRADPSAPGEPLSELEAIPMAGRLIEIIFDSDSTDPNKPGVRESQRRLERYCEGRGAIVAIVTLPAAADGSKQGIDDYLAAWTLAGQSSRQTFLELENAALKLLATRTLARGSDGAEICGEHCPSQDLRAEQQWRRHGPLPPRMADVGSEIARVVRGSVDRTPIIQTRRQLAKATGGHPNDVTDFWRWYEHHQDDPAHAADLTYRIERRDQGGPDERVVIIPLKVGRYALADAYRPIMTWPKVVKATAPPTARPAPASQCPCGGRRHATQRVCDRCAEVTHYPVPTVARTIAADPPTGGTEDSLLDEDRPPPHRFGEGSPGSPPSPPYVHRFGEGGPVSFVSLDAVLVASGPHYVAESEAPPPPPAVGGGSV